MRYLYILLALVYITQSHAQTSNIVGQVINKDSVAIEGVAGLNLYSRNHNGQGRAVHSSDDGKALSVDVPTSGIRSYVLELI